MDEQTVSRLEQLLQDTLEVAEENNRILITMQRTARWTFWGKLLLWTIVLALPFFVLRPFFHALVPVTASETGAQSFLGLPSPEQIQALLSTYQSSFTATSSPQ